MAVTLDMTANEFVELVKRAAEASAGEARREEAEALRQAGWDAFSVWEAYAPAKTYLPLNKVLYEGSTYVCLRETTGNAPSADSPDWLLCAARGEHGPKGSTGVGIQDIQRTAGTGAAGTVDTYTITMTDGSTAVFQVYNGANGIGSGDMLASVYDPQNKNADVFAYVDAAISGVQQALVFDEVPASGSRNPVRSGGVYTALAGKADKNAVDTALSQKADASAVTLALSEKQDQLTGTAGQVVGFGADGSAVAQALPKQQFPVKVEILETICKNVELTDNNPSYTLPKAITFDSKALYFLNYAYYLANGSYSEAVVFSKPLNNQLRWLTNQDNNSVSLTATVLTDTWRGSGNKSVITISKVSITKEDALLLQAVNQAVNLEVNAVAPGMYSHAEGNGVNASGLYSHAEGSGSIASGNRSHAEGSSYTVSGGGLMVSRSTQAEGIGSHAEGGGTFAIGELSHAEGGGTTASGQMSHAEGKITKANGTASHAGGEGTISNDYQSTIGTYNVEKAGGQTADRFIIGSGTKNTVRKNAFRVHSNGSVYGGTYYSSGADYAEYFQWRDGNPAGEDRAGLFVTLEGEKIRLASPEDTYVLGVVSAAPSILGDAYEDQWSGMEERDVFGRVVYEDREFPAETSPDGAVMREARVERVPKLNPDYRPTETYIPRSERTEWDAVGMLGKLVAVDNGSCEVDGFCKVGPGGVATRSNQPTPYRVLARLDATHIKLLIR